MTWVMSGRRTIPVIPIALLAVAICNAIIANTIPSLCAWTSTGRSYQKSTCIAAIPAIKITLLDIAGRVTKAVAQPTPRTMK